MAYNDEQIKKLTTMLAGDIELYNEIVLHEKTQEEQLIQANNDVETLNSKLEDGVKRETEYLQQISNLLGKIPIGETKNPQSFEQKLTDVNNTSWEK